MIRHQSPSSRRQRLFQKDSIAKHFAVELPMQINIANNPNMVETYQQLLLDFSGFYWHFNTKHTKELPGHTFLS